MMTASSGFLERLPIAVSVLGDKSSFLCADEGKTPTDLSNLNNLRSSEDLGKSRLSGSCQTAGHAGGRVCPRANLHSSPDTLVWCAPGDA